MAINMSGRFDDFDRAMYDFIKDFGSTTSYVYIKNTGTTVNDNTGIATATYDEIEIEAIKTELVRPTNGMSTKIGTMIQEGDQVLYIRPTEKVNFMADPLGIDVTRDKVSINGVNWKIVTMKEHNPTADDCIIYELYIRK